ncbi:ribbon-helix-helix protein, CopG family [Alicyclobacillus fastidiosus]
MRKKVPVSVRLDADIVAQIDELAKERSQESGDHKYAV